MSPQPSVGSDRLRGTRSVHFWTWIAILASASVCIAVVWLHYRQRDVVGRAERMLDEVHEARIALSKGFLNQVNASDGESSFERTQGMAWLHQAFDSIRRDPYWERPAESDPDPAFAMTREEFDRKAARLLELLAQWNEARPGSIPTGLGAELRVAYHQIDRLLQRIDFVNHTDFHALNQRLNRQFAIVVASSALLLAGLCSGIFVLIRNETRAVQALLDSEQRFRQLSESLPQLVWTCRADGTCDYLSRQWIEFTGVPSEAQLGFGWLQQLHPEDREPTIARWKDASSRGETFEAEFRVRRHDGAYLWFDTRAVPLRDQDGRVAKWFGSNTDITERRRAREALQEREERIEHLNRVYAVLSDINQAIVRLKDRDAMLSAACEIAVDKGGFLLAWIGLTEPDTGELRIQAHAGADGDALDFLRSAIAQGGCEFAQSARLHGRHSVCNDVEAEARSAWWQPEALRRHFCSLAAFPLLDDTRVVGIFTLYSRETHFFDEAELKLLDELAMDISFAISVHRREEDQRKIEEELRNSEERLRQAQKMEAIGQLAGGVAHDFNNILGAILLQAELVSNTEPLSKEALDGLNDLKSSAERAANLTRQLLAFSRRQVMQVQVLDLNEIVANLAKMFGRIVGEDIRLILALHPRPLVLRADAGMIDQVLLNLVVNARDAMPAGGRLSIETHPLYLDDEEARAIPDARAGHYVCLVVCDTGCGITSEHLPRIFEPFFTTKEPGKGTGLGLATVFGIVKQHRGFLQVETQTDRGSIFRVFLPASPASETARLEPSKPSARVGGRETILIAEDEPSLRRLTRKVLERHGYTVLEATDGADALRVWDQHSGPIHLLLTDIVMPDGVNGHQLATQLLARNPQLRVLFTSGYSAEIAGQEISLKPGQDFLQKPCPPPQLLDAIRRCLDS
ncbi:MAG: response regulator [Verrucomicrobiales bacterium]|nr:response regulator [Verrucomicrobiales bacterium]